MKPNPPTTWVLIWTALMMAGCFVSVVFIPDTPEQAMDESLRLRGLWAGAFTMICWVGAVSSIVRWFIAYRRNMVTSDSGGR